MKLIVSGKTPEFTPELQKKFNTKLGKLSKFIEQKGEREAHLTHQVERHLHKIELSVNFYDHSLVGEGADFDLDTALCQAVEKVEKQVVKLRNRWRDTHRDAKTVRSSKESWSEGATAAPAEEPAPPPPPPPPPAPRTYTVVSGDTLWAIAERFYGDGNKYPQIAEASGISNPDLIHPGQVVTIP